MDLQKYPIVLDILYYSSAGMTQLNLYALCPLISLREKNLSSANSVL